jgi:hypothetical protein
MNKYLPIKNQSSWLLSLILTTLIFNSTNAHAVKILDLMVVYSNTASQHPNGKDMEARVAASIAYTNRAFANSKVGLRFRLVKLKQITNYEGKLRSNDLNRLMNDAQIRQWRDESGADFVTLYGDSNEWCGIGYVTQGNPNTGKFYQNADAYAYNITSIDCGHSTFAHELGHNMSLGHSNKQGSSGGVWKWARGHGIDNVFVTIMGYTSAFNYANRVNLYSNPEINICEGYACGIPIGQPNEANAAEALNRLATQMANFRPSKSSPPAEFSYLTTNQQCMGVDPGALYVIPVDCERLDTLQWRFNEINQLVNKGYPNLCLDPGTEVDDFSKIQLTTCGQGIHQQWRINDSFIQNQKNADRLLTLHPDYRPLIVTGKNSEANQQWQLLKDLPSDPGVKLEYSFETSLEDWSAIYNGATQVSNLRASQGQQSAYNLNRPYWYSGMGLEIKDLLKPQHPYSLNLDVFIEGSGNQTLDIRVLAEDAEGYKWTTLYQQVVPAGNWYRIETPLEYKANPSGLKSAQLMVFGPSAGIAFSIDQIRIQE